MLDLLAETGAEPGIDGERGGINDDGRDENEHQTENRRGNVEIGRLRRDVQHDEHVDTLLDFVERQQSKDSHRHVKRQREDDADADDRRDALRVLHRHLQ